MPNSGHASGAQLWEEEQEEVAVEKAEGRRGKGSLSVQQGSTGKRDGEGENEEASCADTAHAKGCGVRSQPARAAPPRPAAVAPAADAVRAAGAVLTARR